MAGVLYWSRPLTCPRTIHIFSPNVFLTGAIAEAARAAGFGDVEMLGAADEAEIAIKKKATGAFVLCSGGADDILRLLAPGWPAAKASPPILVFADRCNARLLVGLYEAGVPGVFDPRTESPDSLVSALQHLRAGWRYWSRSLEAKLQEQVVSPKSEYARLTTTERVVLASIGDGSSDEEAAALLQMKPSTVATVRREIHRKLGLQRRGELMRKAIELGFVAFAEGRVLRPGFGQLRGARRQHAPRGPARS